MVEDKGVELYDGDRQMPATPVPPVSLNSKNALVACSTESSVEDDVEEA